MLYIVNRVGLVGCASEFLGHIWLLKSLPDHAGLGLVFGCMSPVDMICKYVRVHGAVENITSQKCDCKYVNSHIAVSLTHCAVSGTVSLTPVLASRHKSPL